MGGFPLAQDAVEVAAGTLSRETDELPTVAADTSQVDPFLFSASVIVKYEADFAKPLQDLVNHTFLGSVVFRVALYDTVAKSHVDATDFNFTIDFSGMLRSLIVSSIRYLGTQPPYYYYRLVIGGVLNALPPFFMSFRCGPSTSKTLVGSAYSCYFDVNLAGSFYGAEVTVEAEATRSLRPKSISAMGDSDYYCVSEDCLGPLCSAYSSMYCSSSSEFEFV